MFVSCGFATIWGVTAFVDATEHDGVASIRSVHVCCLLLFAFARVGAHTISHRGIDTRARGLGCYRVLHDWVCLNISVLLRHVWVSAGCGCTCSIGEVKRTSLHIRSSQTRRMRLLDAVAI